MKDLIRTHILQMISVEVNHDKALKKWSNIVENLEACKKANPRLKEETFFLDSWTVFMDVLDDPEKKVYTKHAFEKSFFQTVTKSNAEEILFELEKFSLIYRLIFVGQSVQSINRRKETNVDDLLGDLRIFGVTQYSGFLLHMINGYLSRTPYVNYDMMKYVIGKLVDFHFIFNDVSKDSDNKISPRYKKHFKLLNSKNTPKENYQIGVDLIRSLSSVQTEKSLFISEFNKLKYYNKGKKTDIDTRRVIKYILRKLAGKYIENSTSINFERFTVEHVIPESLNSSGNKKWVGNIANLILLENDDLEDLSFQEKIQKMKTNDVPYPAWLDSVDEMSEELIIIKNEEYADYLYSISDISLQFNCEISESDDNVTQPSKLPNNCSTDNSESSQISVDKIFENFTSGLISAIRQPAGDGWRLLYKDQRIGFMQFSQTKNKYRIYVGSSAKDVEAGKFDYGDAVAKLESVGLSTSKKPKNLYEKSNNSGYRISI